MSKWPPAGERVWAKVDFNGPMQSPYLGPCWIWSGAETAGYGCIMNKAGSKLAHRVAYEAVRGPIEAETLDHLCRVPLCVNPAHLEPVSLAENVRRGHGGRIQREKTHCPHGHPYDEQNTYRRSNGERMCLICKRRQGRETMRRHREAT